MDAVSMISRVEEKHTPPLTIAIIINPVSGFHTDAEARIRAILQGDGVNYQIYTTCGAGDARHFAEAAHQQHVDLVLACGGDGTVKEVAAALHDTDTVMSILPAGTANVMAVELGIPPQLETALRAILAGRYHERAIDIGVIDQNVFLLRAGIGFEAEVSVGASREEKSRLGRLAYFHTAWRKLRGLKRAEYRILLDDRVVVAHGITCLICNSTSLGLPNMKLGGESSVSDGVLDVIVIPSLRPAALLKMVGDVLTNALPQTMSKPRKTPDRWQAKMVTVETRHKQQVAVDGEPFKRAKRVTAQIVPGALRIAIPEA